MDIIDHSDDQQQRPGQDNRRHPIRQDRIHQHGSDKARVDRYATEPGRRLHMNLSLSRNIDKIPAMTDLDHHGSEGDASQKSEQEHIEPPYPLQLKLVAHSRHRQGEGPE